MKSLKIDFENCYGIKKLVTEFDFENSNLNLLYAPNGSMKTCFAKTFYDISKGKNPKDLIFTDRNTVCNVKKNDNLDFDLPILVIESYSESYSSKESMTMLLANNDLKARYAEIFLSIEQKKDDLFKEIKKISGSSNAETEILQIFKKSTIFECLESLKEDVSQTDFIEQPFKYGEIINDKVSSFLKDNQRILSDYLERYNQVVESSTLFKKGIFGTDNAVNIRKSLGDNRFFDAEHKLVLKDSQEINNPETLDQLILQNKEKVLKDEQLRKDFDKIDTAITKNADLKKLKGILELNPELLVNLANYEDFKKELWINYFAGAVDLYNILLKEYDDSQVEINQIIDQAKQEQTEWESVIKIFNNRFKVPFVLGVKNKENVILKDKEVPNIEFTYFDGRSSEKVDESKLKGEVLSTGEKRALYILNVIFEIQARQKQGGQHLFIFDDIADSFDYKNKYAIIEYLKDIAETENFKIIILTHNFDFYRTLASRIPVLRDHCLMTIKDENSIKLVQGEYLRNVFTIWLKKIHTDEKIFISSIPFVRNLLEYINGETDGNYLLLTHLLHQKVKTKNLKNQDLIEIYKIFWRNKDFNAFSANEMVYSLIMKKAEEILLESSDTVQLENKIILSMASRLLAEDFMIKKIDDVDKVSLIQKNQTTALLKLYKLQFVENVDILEQVNLLTAENIHINSFMYEPILDLSDDYLKKLYSNTKALN